MARTRFRFSQPIAIPIIDSKGFPKLLHLRNVLYAPDLKFNLLSVPAAVKDDFPFTFNRKQCANVANQLFSIKAHIAENFTRSVRTWRQSRTKHSSLHMVRL